ncbi:MAG: ferredoxin [Patescibacteria group bacterium]
MAGKIKYLMVDRELCIGAASCVALYPEVFQLDDDNKAVILKKDGIRDSGKTDVDMLEVSAVDDDTLMLAAQSCPTLAIYLYEEDGTQVYP